MLILSSKLTGNFCEVHLSHFVGEVYERPVSKEYHSSSAACAYAAFP